jgi:hypothetical protein
MYTSVVVFEKHWDVIIKDIIPGSSFKLKIGDNLIRVSADKIGCN